MKITMYAHDADNVSPMPFRFDVDGGGIYRGGVLTMLETRVEK